MRDRKDFCFRDIHPYVRIGTASDRYAGWTGQIYTCNLYEGRIISRKKTSGGKSYQEKVLPIDSVREYFEHFGILEIDASFYQTLLDAGGKPTRNNTLLRRYEEHLQENDRVILKVPQIIFAPKILSRGKYTENPNFLDHNLFTRTFYLPAVEILGEHISGFIFEQPYLRKEERTSSEAAANALDKFFSSLPSDDRYHVELRTSSYLSDDLFTVFKNLGIGQVLSHWTWLPSLLEQHKKAGCAFLNRGGQCVIRLLTPRGMRYEESFAKAFPFDKLIDGMLDLRMVEETAEIMWNAVNGKVNINVIVNNRAGGNAPLIARAVSDRFLSGRSSER